MVTRFEPSTGLDATVARRFALPAVERALERMHDLARTNAPPVKVWITARDERVRRTHQLADGQAVPENLRFRLRTTAAPEDDSQHDLARYPRDPDLPIGNRINCRCQDPRIPDMLARSIHRTTATVQGNRVGGEVYTRFPRAAESEFGTSGDTPARYMTRALQETATRMRATRSR